jgi:hypothetical protein
MKTVKIFLSSTFADFAEERLQMLEVFRRLRTIEGLDVDLITMEDFGFSDAPPLDKCLELLSLADAYLGLLGQRYGSMPPGGKLSYTEREYRLAHKKGMPIFVLERVGRVLASEIETDAGKLARLQKLRAHAHTNHLVLGFDSPQELGKVLAQFLPGELRRSFPAERLALGRTSELLVPYFRLAGRKSSFTQERPVASTLDVLAISAIGFLRDRSTIEAYLRQGCRIRILVVKRGGVAERLILQNKGGDHFSNDLEQAISRGRELSQSTQGLKGSMEMREIDWVPSVTLFLYDIDSPSAIGWVGPYTPDISTSSGEKWMVELAGSDASSALRFYAAQFEKLWARSQPAW